MNSVLSTGKVIQIGNEYADKMNYSELYRSDALVLEALTHVVTVQVLTGPEEAFKKEIDIHISDAILNEEETPEYFVLINHESGTLYYTEDMNTLLYMHALFSGREHSMLKDISSIHGLVNDIERDYGDRIPITHIVNVDADSDEAIAIQKGMLYSKND